MDVDGEGGSSTASLTVHMGLADSSAKDAGLEPVTFDRFQSRRLGARLGIASPDDADESIPDKPGFLFNAGGPVWGLDWCPLPDRSEPSRALFRHEAC